MIVVIGQHQLFLNLILNLPNSIRIISLPKSQGVVEKSQIIQTQFQISKIHEYFYGFRSNLCPHNILVKFIDIKLYYVGAPKMSEALLPLRMNQEENYTKIFNRVPSYGLLNHVLSIINAPDDREEQFENSFLKANILGYLVITEIDTDKGSMVVMSSLAELPPKCALLVSNFKF